jgi:hypothetical protein
MIGRMNANNEQRRTATYLLLLAVQLLGAITFIWQALPEFRLIAENPGEQLPRDTFSDLFSFSVLCAMQFAFWFRVRRVPIPFWHPHLVLQHVFLFLGRLSFIFGSALFGIVVFRHLPELDRNIDLLLTAKRGVIMLGCLFALFCTSLEVERLGHAFESGRQN